MRFDLIKVILLKPYRLKNGGWVRVAWCAKSHFSYFRTPYHGYGRDHLEIRVYKLLVEYKRDALDEPT